MRTLKFNVTNDIITKDPLSDFSMLSKESVVELRFSFDENWDGYVKVLKFTRGNVELEPKVLINGYACEVPYKALNGTFLRLSVLGKKGTNQKATKTFLLNLNEPEKGGNR